jgi:hypothetical protein
MMEIGNLYKSTNRFSNIYIFDSIMNPSLSFCREMKNDDCFLVLKIEPHKVRQLVNVYILYESKPGWLIGINKENDHHFFKLVQI